MEPVLKEPLTQKNKPFNTKISPIISIYFALKLAPKVRTYLQIYLCNKLCFCIVTASFVQVYKWKEPKICIYSLVFFYLKQEILLSIILLDRLMYQKRFTSIYYYDDFRTRSWSCIQKSTYYYVSAFLWSGAKVIVKITFDFWFLLVTKYLSKKKIR